MKLGNSMMSYVVWCMHAIYERKKETLFHIEMLGT